ncbi:MAG TPA: hypothetical protein VHA52_09380, partial [Candidatus Babeliaceae bacterium]|nr:hypothetical protein [Candidatus Babeliaceae bacterium]
SLGNITMQRGIVLRSYGHENKKVAILDEELGHVEAFFSCASAPHGSLLTYMLNATTSRKYRILQPNIIMLPQDWARLDIIFLHHMLELCSKFLPFNSKNSAVFLLLSQWYTLTGPFCYTESFKKLFIAKFFLFIGWLPEPKQDQVMLMNLISSPIDIMFEGELDRYSIAQLDIWLEACIGLHPLAHCLKTVPFFLKAYNRDYER